MRSAGINLRQTVESVGLRPPGGIACNDAGSVPEAVLSAGLIVVPSARRALRLAR